MLSRSLKKKIAHFYGRDYDYWDDIIDSLALPCIVSAVTAFFVTVFLAF